MDPDQRRWISIEPGLVLGHYRVIQKIGAGGMGEVFLADDTKLGRQVAIKVLPAEIAGDKDRLERFEREARALAALDHPGIVTIFSVESAIPAGSEESAVESEPVHFLTMQRVEGQPLHQSIGRGGMSLERFLDVAVQLTDAVAAAHEKGIIHRDLKPGNVMVSAEGRVRVLDFGLAKLRPQGADLEATELPTQTLTQEGLVVGTVPYMSPEQVRGQEADTRSDIFSLGVILYEMATGVRPFEGNTSVNLVLSIVQDVPRPVDERRPDLPDGLTRVIRRCLEKEPGRRYQSILDLRHDLEEVEVDRPRPQAETSGSRRRLGQQVVGALLLVAAIGFAGWSWLQGRPHGETSGARVAPAETQETGPDSHGLVAKRVLVVPFENRTGEAELDPVGLMAADWITQGLSQTGLVEVVSSVTALSSLRNVAQAVANDHRSPTFGELAEETGAGTVITGAYYLQGNDLLFSAEANDSIAGRLVGAVEPARTSTEEPLGAIEELRQRLMVLVASHLDERLESRGPPFHLPSFGAYREATLGVEQFIRMNFRAAIDHSQRATELDPDWVRPLLTAAMAHINLGEFAEAEALSSRVAPHRDSLAVVDQYLLDRIVATCQEKLLEALHFSRLAAELSPNGPSAFDAGALAVRANYAQEAVDRLEALDPERGFLRGFAPYWHYLTESHHILGDYETELDRALRAKELYPDHLDPRWFEVRALAGLGRHEQVEPLLVEAEVLPSSGLTPGSVMRRAACELQAHGSPEAALGVAQRAVEWYRDRPQEQLSQAAWQSSLGRALVVAEELEEAMTIFSTLVREYPEQLQNWGYYGVLGARRNDDEAVQKALKWFRQVDRPYLFGIQIYWQSAIHSWQGDHQEAVRLYREALAAGLPFGWPREHPHADPMVEPLWDYPPFENLIAPRD